MLNPISNNCNSYLKLLSLKAVNFLKAFYKSEDAHVGVMFGFSIIPLATAVGMSVDYSSAINSKTRIQAALDSAALAGGRMLQTSGSVSEAEAAAIRHFNAAIGDSINASLIVDSINPETGTVKLSGKSDVPTSFTGIIGVNSIEVTSSTEAVLAVGDKDIEISMMLDVTGSMGGSKIRDMKLAAKDLVQIILQGNRASQKQARIALIPFSESVNVRRYAEEVANAASATTKFRDNRGRNKTWKVAKACVSERTGSEAFTDARPNGRNKIDTLYTSNGTCKPNNELVPLTDSQSSLESAIDGMSATGLTAGHLGTAWAWYTLSPNWRTVWPPKSRPGAYNPDSVDKIAILMTDGEYNTQYYNGVMTRYQQRGTKSPNGTSDEQADQLCVNMKKSGLTVYTIGFELDSRKAKETLKECATSKEHYFLAEDGDKLREVFREIAFQISNLRISK